MNGLHNPQNIAPEVIKPGHRLLTTKEHQCLQASHPVTYQDILVYHSVIGRWIEYNSGRDVSITYCVPNDFDVTKLVHPRIIEKFYANDDD